MSPVLQRTRAGVLAIVVALGACSAASVERPSQSGSGAPRVLYVTHSAGYRHDVLPFSEEILRELGAKTRAFDVTVSRECCSLLAADALRTWDAVVFYTTGELPMDAGQREAFLDFVRGGKGFVGIHSATDTFYEWPEYGELIGGYFDGHPWHQPVRIRVEDPGHAATRHLESGFELKDEIYQFRTWSRDRVHVLLSLDPSSVDLTAGGVNRTDRDFALAWTREYGSGRVFYTALGHEADVWRDPRFQQHVAGGITWALAGR